jgi:hypothetical protein
MELHIEVTTLRGYDDMNINDKITILDSRIEYNKSNLEEHYRILREDLHLLIDGDEDVIRNMVTEIKRVINALEDAKTAFTNSLEIL